MTVNLTYLTLYLSGCKTDVFSRLYNIHLTRWMEMNGYLVKVNLASEFPSVWL